MKKITQSFLHLPLNEISYGAEKHWTTPDLGMGTIAPKIFGNPEIIHDAELGTCIKLDGIDDYIELPSLAKLNSSQGLTIAVWIRLDKDKDRDEGWNTILMLNAAPAIKTNNSANAIDNEMFLSVNITGELFFSTDTYGQNISGYRYPEIITDTWFHLAISLTPSLTIDQRNVTIFINASPVYNTQLAYYAGVGDTNLFYCAKFSSAYPSLFKGSIAHLRVEETAFSEQQIIDLMQHDRHQMARFRTVYPLEIDLYSVYQEDQLKVLYLESPGKGEPLQLAISNTSQSCLTFATFPENADNTHYHIQLGFRKNVISPEILKALRTKKIKLEGISHYQVSEGHDSLREDWIALKWASKETLNVGQTKVISIPNFSASARGGARNTRIEVRFSNLQLGSGQQAKLDGSVIRHMEIQSHLGRKTLPLYPTIKGSNTILNDGVTSNALVIQIHNTNPDKPISFSNKADHPEAPSRFELSVKSDLFSDKKATEHILEASTAHNGLVQHREDGTDDLVSQFTFTDNSTPSLANNYISLRLNNWVSKADTGAHYLKLRYKNIPGYQDGEWILPILMGPMVIRTIDGEKRVGIGTNHPKAKLHVKGNTLIEASEVLIKSKTVIEGKVLIKGDAVIQGDVKSTGEFEDGAGLVMPVGSIIAYGGNIKEWKEYNKKGIKDNRPLLKAPKGWLLCNGQTINANKHRLLHKLVGANTPNLRDRFIVGAGWRYNPTRSGGQSVVTLKIDQMPSHQHFGFGENWNFPWSLGMSGKNIAGGDGKLNMNNAHYGTTYAGGAGNPKGDAASAKETKPHENRPPYYALVYIIKC